MNAKLHENKNIKISKKDAISKPAALEKKRKKRKKIRNTVFHHGVFTFIFIL